MFSSSPSLPEVEMASVACCWTLFRFSCSVGSSEIKLWLKFLLKLSEILRISFSQLLKLRSSLSHDLFRRLSTVKLLYRFSCVQPPYLSLPRVTGVSSSESCVLRGKQRRRCAPAGLQSGLARGPQELSQGSRQGCAGW